MHHKGHNMASEIIPMTEVIPSKGRASLITSSHQVFCAAELLEVKPADMGFHNLNRASFNVNGEAHVD